MTAEEKRKAEMATVKKMLEIYCRAHHGNNLSLCEECELCPCARRALPAHGDEDVLQCVPDALLRAQDARKNPRSHALQRPAHAAPRARHGASAHVHRVAREAALKAVSRGLPDVV